MAVNSFKGCTVRPQYPAISIVSLVPEPVRHCPTSRSRCPSNEAAGNHSKPARFLFRDGGRYIFPCAHRTTTIHPSDPSRLTSLPFHREAWSILKCARRTSTFRACAFREQEDGQAAHLTLRKPHAARTQKDHQAPSPPQFCEQEGHLAAPFPFSAPGARTNSGGIPNPILGNRHASPNRIYPATPTMKDSKVV